MFKFLSAAGAALMLLCLQWRKQFMTLTVLRYLVLLLVQLERATVSLVRIKAVSAISVLRMKLIVLPSLMLITLNTPLLL